jgi:pyrroline-5-carboxylate reductase
MKKNFKFGVIGAGFMATAIIKGVISSGLVMSSDILVSDVYEPALNNIKQLGVSVTTDNKYLVDSSEFILFAVKPQSLTVVLDSIKECEPKKIISIMAGIKRQRIKNVFPNAKIARCMPNTPCSIGFGAVGIDLSDFSNEQDVEFIKSLFTSFADVVVLNESKMNAVTGVSGSAPAYFYLFLQGVIDAGVSNGLSYEDAKILATKTMIGAGNMVLQNNEKSLDELINAVCSKGGTTIEAVNVYKANDLSNITKKAVDACVKRSTELENV